MRERSIDELWQTQRVDRLVQEALDQVLQSDAFVKLIRRQEPELALVEVRKSLQRARIRVSYPEIVEPGRTIVSSNPGSGVSEGSSDRVTQAVGRTSDNAEFATPPSGMKKSRKLLATTRDLFDAGLLRPGVFLTIRNHPSSEAEVIDGRKVRYASEVISFNEWGKKVTGWSAVQIYTIAVMPDGRSLAELRDELVPKADN